MHVLSVTVVVGVLTALAGQVVQSPAASADMAAIEKLHQQEIPE